MRETGSGVWATSREGSLHADHGVVDDALGQCLIVGALVVVSAEHGQVTWCEWVDTWHL